MNNYDQLRQHWTHLPVLPDPDKSDLEFWAPENPEKLHQEIGRHNVWGYVDSRVKAKLEAIIESRRPPPLTAEEQLAKEIEDFKKLGGARNIRLVEETPGGGLIIAWDAAEGWEPDRYQVLGRSEPLHGDEPTYDDPFANPPRYTWTALGGYDQATGPIRGGHNGYYIDPRWLMALGPPPFQITVQAWHPKRGAKITDPVTMPREQEPQPVPEEVKPRQLISRDEYIYQAVKNFTGKRTRSGAPYVRALRSACNIPNITVQERNKAWERAKNE